MYDDKHRLIINKQDPGDMIFAPWGDVYLFLGKKVTGGAYPVLHFDAIKKTINKVWTGDGNMFYGILVKNSV
jgi:hypothetical protein